MEFDLLGRLGGYPFDRLLLERYPQASRTFLSLELINTRKQNTKNFTKSREMNSFLFEPCMLFSGALEDRGLTYTP